MSLQIDVVVHDIGPTMLSYVNQAKAAKNQMNDAGQAVSWPGMRSISDRAYNANKSFADVSALAAGSQASEAISVAGQISAAPSLISSSLYAHSCNSTAHAASVNLSHGTSPDLSSKLWFLGSALMTLALWLLLVCAVLVIFWKLLCLWWRRRQMLLSEDASSDISHLPLPPGDTGLPILGETLEWLVEGSNFNANRRKKYGNVFKTNIIFEPVVKVTGHDYVKEVLSGEHDKVTTIWPHTIRTLLGVNGIANSLGSAHYYKRKIASKAFSRAALNSYIPSILDKCRRNVTALKEVETPKVYDKILRLTFDVAMSSLVGFNIQDEKEATNLFQLFCDFASNVICLPLNIPGLGFHKALKAKAKLFDLLHEHATEKQREFRHRLASSTEDDIVLKDALGIIQFEEFKRRARLSADEAEKDVLNNNWSGSQKREAFDDQMEEHHLSILAMKEMIMELMLAGYYTTSSAITSALLELSRNKHVQRELEEELLRHGLLEEGCGPASSDRLEDIDMQQLHKLQYLDQVVKETLRIRPPVLGGYRRARKTFQLGNYRIPKGWTVVYNIRDTHEYESEDMDTFEPDRFAGVGKDGKENKYRFLPFGSGPRLCIGQEFAKLIIKLTIIEMVRQYEGWDYVNEGLPKMVAIPVLRPADGLPLNLSPRKHPGVIAS